MVRETICTCSFSNCFVSIAKLAICSFDWVNTNRISQFQNNLVLLMQSIHFPRVPIALDMILRKRELLDFCKYALISLAVVLVNEMTPHCSTTY